MKRLRALAVTLALWISPAIAANQAPLQVPTTGPLSATQFTSNYLNPALIAAGTCNWGTSAPANGIGLVANFGQCWIDTSGSPSVVYKIYDGASWVSIGTLNTSTHAWSVSATSLAYSTTLTGTSTNAACAAIGRLGATNPALQVDCSAGSQAAGVKITGAATAGPVTIEAIDSGANTGLDIKTKGSGNLRFYVGATVALFANSSLLASGLPIVTAAQGGIGYQSGGGVGSTCTQQTTNRNTGITCNAITGSFQLVSATNAATTPALANSITVTNSSITAVDTVQVNQKTGSDYYFYQVTSAAGSFTMKFYSPGTATEAPSFTFTTLKGSIN